MHHVIRTQEFRPMAAVDVRIPTIMRPHTGGAAKVSITGDTVGQIITDLVTQFPGIAGQIVTPDGELHRFVNVYVNDDDVRYIGKLDAPVKDGDSITILPAVAGGAL
jgi:sulfur-carrier protein